MSIMVALQLELERVLSQLLLVMGLAFLSQLAHHPNGE